MLHLFKNHDDQQLPFSIGLTDHRRHFKHKLPWSKISAHYENGLAVAVLATIGEAMVGGKVTMMAAAHAVLISLVVRLCAFLLVRADGLGRREGTPLCEGSLAALFSCSKEPASSP